MVAPPPDGGASAGRPPESSPAPRRRRTAFSGSGWGTPGLHPGRADFFCATSRCSAHILASAAGSTGEGRRPSRQDGRDVSGKTGDPCLLFAHAPIAGVHDLHPARAHRPGSPRAAGLRLLPGDHPQRGGQPSRSTPLEHRLNVSGLEEARRPEDFNRSASISLDRRLPDAALSPEFLDKRERPPGVDRWRPPASAGAFPAQALGCSAIHAGHTVSITGSTSAAFDAPFPLSCAAATPGSRNIPNFLYMPPYLPSPAFPSCQAAGPTSRRLRNSKNRLAGENPAVFMRRGNPAPNNNAFNPLIPSCAHATRPEQTRRFCS